MQEWGHELMSYFVFIPDQAFLQFYGDEFLRLLMIRFVFCCATLRLHKLFRVRQHSRLDIHVNTLFHILVRFICLDSKQSASKNKQLKAFERCGLTLRKRTKIACLWAVLSIYLQLQAVLLFHLILCCKIINVMFQVYLDHKK